MNAVKKLSLNCVQCKIHFVRYIFCRANFRNKRMYSVLNVNTLNSIKSVTISNENTSLNSNNVRVYSKKILPKEVKAPKSYFRKMMDARKHEAERSVLLEMPKKSNVAYAFTLCEKFGTVANIYSYAGENDNIFLLVEFSDEQSTKHLLQYCQFRNIVDVFPVFSRMIQLNGNLNLDLPNVKVNVIEDNFQEFSPRKDTSLCEIMEGAFVTEKLSELNTRLRYFFCVLIKESISGLFPYADVLPFGSSVNGIGKHGCDLDVMVRLYPEEIQNDCELNFLNKTCVGDARVLQQKAIFCLGDYIRTFFPGISAAQKIIHARMPIIKLRHKLLKMDCDVSINNMAAIFMSEIIHFCGEIDSRVRPLMYSVKKWAKAASVTNYIPGAWITNFGLTILVIFFLQNRPQPILPPLNDALVISGSEASFDFGLKYLKSLEELKEVASLNKEPSAVLLKEFFSFLGTYSFGNSNISLMDGKGRYRESGGSSLYIQYPLEEGLNITKNVSDYEFWELCEKAQISAKYLENNLKEPVRNIKDFNFSFGVGKRQDVLKTKKVDISSIVGDNKSSKKKIKQRV